MMKNVSIHLYTREVVQLWLVKNGQEATNVFIEKPNPDLKRKSENVQTLKKILNAEKYFVKRAFHQYISLMMKCSKLPGDLFEKYD